MYNFLEKLKRRRRFAKTYGISYKWFKRYSRLKSSRFMLLLLERRLDSILYRTGFCRSIAEARQLIIQKKVLVNGMTKKSPSFQVTSGDIVEMPFRNSLLPKAMHLETNKALSTAIFLYSPQKLYFSDKL